MKQPDFLSLFPRKKPILAMLHLRGESRQEKYEHALLEAGQLIGGGADAVIVVQASFSWILLPGI